MLRVPLDDTDESDDGRLFYDGEPFTGVTVESAADGTLLSEASYTDGLQHGPERLWWPGNGLRLERIYEYGSTVREREWHRNGRLARETHMKNGRRVSEQRWDEDGNPVVR